MKIALMTPWIEAYLGDKFFDPKCCPLGENLLLPNIALKDKLESMGHEVHTIDMYDLKDIDVCIFFDIPPNTIYAKLYNPLKVIKYFLKRWYRTDYLYKLLVSNKKVKKILVIQETPAVLPSSHKKHLHKLFDVILTWKEEWIDNKKYFKYLYPQPYIKKNYNVLFSNKKFLTMICGNKTSKDSHELYTKRKEIINLLKDDKDFDLYGMHWEKENLPCYKGRIQKKLDVLSQYKFSIAFENYLSADSYITEKIFDCFFANVVPVYYGSSIIDKYIPSNCFIDYRNFKSDEDMISCLKNMSESEYNNYINNINIYLNSNSFKDNFSLEANIDNMLRHIL